MCCSPSVMAGFDADHPHWYEEGREKELGVGEKMLLIAVGCGRLPGILAIAATHRLVVFGTMDERAAADLAADNARRSAAPTPVYFYETG